MEKKKKGHSLPGWTEFVPFTQPRSEESGKREVLGREDMRFWEYWLSAATASEGCLRNADPPAAQFDWREGQKALPVLLSLRRWRIAPAPATQDDRVLELHMLAEGTLLGDKPGCILSWRRDTLALFLYEPNLPAEEELRTLCMGLSNLALECFQCDLACYLGEVDCAEGAAVQVDLLRKGDMDNVTDTRAVRTLAQLREHKEQLSRPVLRDWMPYFIDGREEEFCRCIEDYFRQAVAANTMNRAFLAHFQQDFIQEVGFALKNAGIALHELFSDMDELLHMESAIRCLPDMQEWVRWSARKAICLMHPEEKGKTLSERVCEYLARRLVYPFRREELARALHLSEGHIARVFRAEMGMTITEYLTGERIKLACRTIQQTDLPLTQVAEQCGFHDYPYFNKTFRKRVGMSPRDYQRKMRESD